MKNQLIAKVIGFDPQIEEKVTLLIKNRLIICFASYCPYKLEVGKEYPIEFSFQFFDDDILLEQSESDIKDIERINSAYSYMIFGKLKGNTLDSGIKFVDDDLFLECWELDNKYVKLKVDRLDVLFLNRN